MCGYIHVYRFHENLYLFSMHVFFLEYKNLIISVWNPVKKKKEMHILTAADSDGQKHFLQSFLWLKNMKYQFYFGRKVCHFWLFSPHYIFSSSVAGGQCLFFAVCQSYNIWLLPWFKKKKWHSGQDVVSETNQFTSLSLLISGLFYRFIYVNINKI